MEIDRIYNMDCLDGLKLLPDSCVDLIVTDPPYQIDNTQTGGGSKLNRSIQNMNNEIKEAGITQGFDRRILDEMMRVMKTPNLYIWCNTKQVPMYIDFFVKNHRCAFDVLFWCKTNAAPLFNNKYLSDKELCLYFRRGGYCRPENYEAAKTVFLAPINKKDKDTWGHPTIKPQRIISQLIRNSSKEGDIVLDPFMGSGTTAAAAIRENRHFIGYELSKKYFEIATRRIQIERATSLLF